MWNHGGGAADKGKDEGKKSPNPARLMGADKRPLLEVWLLTRSSSASSCWGAEAEISDNLTSEQESRPRWGIKRSDVWQLRSWWTQNRADQSQQAWPVWLWRVVRQTGNPPAPLPPPPGPAGRKLRVRDGERSWSQSRVSSTYDSMGQLTVNWGGCRGGCGMCGGHETGHSWKKETPSKPRHRTCERVKTVQRPGTLHRTGGRKF